MADLYEVLLVDEGTRWHAGWIVDDETETDVLLRDHGKVVLFGSRAALEHHAQEHGRDLLDDLPDEIDLDLGGWLSTGMPLPSTAEVSELWHLLYDDLVEDAPDWFAQHGSQARAALADAVRRLRGTTVRA